MNITIDLTAFQNIAYTGVTELWGQLNNISSIHGLKSNFPNLSNLKHIELIIRSGGVAKTVQVTLQNDNIQQYSLSDFLAYCENSGVAVKCDSITYRPNTDSQSIYETAKVFATGLSILTTYILKCERDKVKKVIGTDIIKVGEIRGTYKNSVSVKSPIIDVQDFELANTYNYVYVLELNRYYYVQSVELVTNKMTRLYLQEDVLNSFADLILLQSALVIRSESNGDLNKVDDTVTYNYAKKVTKTVVTYKTTIFPATQNEEDTRINSILITVAG